MTVKEAVPVHDEKPAAQEHNLIKPVGFTPVQVKSARARLFLSKQALIVTACLLISIFALTYLIMARSLIFDTNPIDARIKISGFSIPLGDGHLVLPGTYRFSISAEGYLPQNGEVEVKSQGHSRHSVSLEKLPGHLLVETTPQVPVKILINGSETPNNNGLVEGITAGPMRVTILSERYLPFTREINIEGLDNTHRLEANLRPGWANISISSNPSGATVTVEGKILGKTPLTTELVQGDRKVSVSLPEHKGVDIPVAVTAGVDQTLATVSLGPADGLLRVVTIPEGAGVTVDGEFRGHTPLELELSSGQIHRLRFFKDGYASIEHTIDLSAGTERDLNINLNVVHGKVHVSSVPPDAKVYIDGQYAGISGQTFNLPARSHTIVVRKEGYQEFDTRVIPSTKLEQTVRAVLLTSEQARWRQVPSTFRHAAGGTLKLMRPNAVFTMGSSRREQGRRANEVMRQVSLNRPFYIGTTEVTNREYRQYKRLHTSSHVNGISLDNDNLPVVNINWTEAVHFCNWLSDRDGLTPVYLTEAGRIVGFDAAANGYRLPTEAEWAWVARYDRGTMRKFPWGNDLPIKSDSGNYADTTATKLVPVVLRTYSDRYAATSPVASYSANEFGIYDLGGNVSEWIHDLYTIGTGLSSRMEENPVGPQDGDYHVIRGSSWRHSGLTELRLSYRDYGETARNDIGFRLARWIN
ncbi:SUMF1/EgtB/PvdO family nonheme iron enzyme [Microbulbifer sp. OS29]|uniref:SUMF1/EgtB/PvdO family nonheme iron enzyme n=1 Tax=Microbulbifer okhotskensis TaxID=2926617 RepID=A0A9X2EKA5_9GAMM|nr:PEGA domain-containing protein [Microbulbifer okhotskensis]MCO1333219.1 SUMF1/EgtB/PvdO family nonheme iron enzyme [Microbulbifer okhotskensis]